MGLCCCFVWCENVSGTHQSRLNKATSYIAPGLVLRPFWDIGFVACSPPHEKCRPDALS